MASKPVWTVAENFAPSGCDPRTAQPVANCYTDYAIPAPGTHMIHYKFTENVKSNLKGKTKWKKYLQVQNNNRMGVNGTGCETGWFQ